MSDTSRDGTQKVYYGRGDRVNYERPVSALDMQLALLDFARTADFDQTLERFTQTYVPAMDGDILGIDDPDSREQRREAFQEAFLRPGIVTALNGMAQYVSAEMCQLVTDIAVEMPPEMLFPTDMQFFDGLIMLGQKLDVPQYGVDEEHRLLDRDSFLGIRAIGYSHLPEYAGVKVADGRTTEGIQIFLYAAHSDVINFTNSSQKLIDRLNSNSALGRTPLVLADHFVWAFGSPWNVADLGDVLSASKTSPKVAWVRRWLLALWRLMWQEILHPDPFRVDRPAVKRAVRLMPQRHDGDVLRVIRLRKIDETADDWRPDGGDAMRELRHGYWRRGHWRTLHRDEDTERKVYVKGHAVRPDLPQADSYKVVSVER